MKPQSEEITRDEAEEVLEHAAKASAEDKVRVADVVSAGKEVGLTDEDVQTGFDAVAARKQQSEERRKMFKRAVLTISLVVILMNLLYAIGLITTKRNLHLDLQIAQMDRAAVRSAIERQETISAAFASAQETPERNAEIAGAANRVTIARRRYDEAAVVYNDLASGFFGRIATDGLTLPKRIPFSNEVISW